MKLTKMTETRKQNCPACGVFLNAASNLLDDCPPEPGDITICVACRAILAFGEAMDLRLATPEEINRVDNELNQTTLNLKNETYTLLNTPGGTGMLCHLCGLCSFNPHDIKNRYCAHCHKFLDD